MQAKCFIVVVVVVVVVAVVVGMKGLKGLCHAIWYNYFKEAKWCLRIN